MINELLEQQGSFTVRLSGDAPFQLLETLAPFGHIVITPQALNPNLFADATLLAQARYAGVVLNSDLTDGSITISGAGMVWWLGDEQGVGPIIETQVDLSASTLSNALTNLLPDAITSGTVTNTGVGTYTGVFQWETPLSAIRTVMQTLGCHFKVQPDGTMDACLTTESDANNPYVMNSPTVVVVRKGWGSDPNYDSVPAKQLKTTMDARDYATRAILVDMASDGTGTLNASSDLSPATGYKDIHGNAAVRTFQAERVASENVDLDSYLSTEMTSRVVDYQQEIDTDQYEITGGHLGVGDTFYVYDPPSGFVDTSNEIWFRGDTIWPLKSRLLEVSWPVADPMGVYYRDSAGVYTDLTRWFVREAS